MLHQINGLHHVTSLASSASENNTFFSEGLGLRRIKATVNSITPRYITCITGMRLEMQAVF